MIATPRGPDEGDSVRLRLALHGDSWLTFHIEAGGGREWTCRTDVFRPIADRLADWVECLARNAAPLPIEFDEEPTLVTLSLEPADDGSSLHLIMLRSSYDRAVCATLTRAELAQKIDAALVAIGRRNDWSKPVIEKFGL